MLGEKDGNREERKRKEKHESNIVSGLFFQFPDVDKIRCKDCVYRARDNGNVKGAALAICDHFSEYDKPIDILFNGAECEYYAVENTKD